MTMTTTLPKPMNNLLVKTMNVAGTDVNENGLLSNCTMLQEVTQINDNAMIAAFGKLNFEGISVARYNINFHNEAVLGDQLKIESTYSVYDKTNLTVIVAVRKTDGQKNTTVLTGSFTFIDNSQKR